MTKFSVSQKDMQEWLNALQSEPQDVSALILEMVRGRTVDAYKAKDHTLLCDCRIIAKEIGRCENHVATLLRRLEADGKIRRVIMNRRARWVTV